MRRHRFSSVAVMGACVVALATAAPAAARTHVPESFFGVLTTTVKPYEAPSPARTAELRRLHAAGVGAIRVTLARPYPSDALDGFVLDAARAHIQVVPMVMDASRTSATGADRGYTPPRPARPFAAYVGALAHRFGPHGTLWSGHRRLRRYAVTTWQVWNEPNLPVYWRPRPSPSEYLKMLKAVSGAIRRYEPRAQIVTAGIPDSSQSKPLSYTRYLQRLLGLGAWRYVTAIGVHAYSRSLRDLSLHLRAIRRLADRAHGRKLKLLITEIGWADRGHKSAFVVGAKKQAALIKGAYRLAAKQRRRWKIAGMFYFEWRDPTLFAPGAHTTSWGYHTGLLKADGKPKRAYWAYKQVVRQLR